MPRFLRTTFGDLLNVWRDTRQIVLVAQTAAIYAAILIPFKVGIPLIPGFAELRPANAIPIVASFLFGPVAAWGAGLGNLIGDCFGTLGPASLFGFLGNFFYGLLPYLLWNHLGPLSSGQRLDFHSWRQRVEFFIICILSSLACALIIAWGVEWLGLVPFRILAAAIFSNNLIMSLVLAPPLFMFLYPRVTRWGLRFEDIRVRTITSDFPSSTSAPSPQLTSTFTPPPCISLQHTSFSYHSATAPALNRISLNIQQGEAVTIMGSSGAGKSSLLLTLNGLIPHQATGSWGGKVLVNQQDTQTRPVWEQATDVGLLFQDFEAQLVSTNVKRELLFPLECLASRNNLISSQEVEQRVQHILDLVGLSGLESRNPLTLSGGQRQRLALGTVLISQPPILALDEAMTDLDPVGRKMMISMLSKLRQKGHTVLVAEHDPEIAVHMGKIVVLAQGNIMWEGKALDLFSRPHLQPLLQQHGLSPLPIASIFSHLPLTQYPTTIEEAWALTEESGFTLNSDMRERSHHPPMDPDHAPILLEAQQACFEYEPGTRILSDMNVTIRQGEFVAIVGHNGSGKSTFANLLTGLHTPSQGQILIQGRNMNNIPPGERATMIGFVFQNPDHQIFAETVEDEVSFGLFNFGYNKEQRHQRVTEALEAVGLHNPDIRTQDPFSLTKGTRQRIAVASVLATRPSILVFDEPTTGLDAQETTRMMNMLASLNQQGHTVIMVTHSIALVGSYAHRCLIVQNGTIYSDGTTRQIFTQLLNPHIESHTGLEVPAITKFAARWGHTYINAQEIQSALHLKA